MLDAGNAYVAAFAALSRSTTPSSTPSSSPYNSPSSSPYHSPSKRSRRKRNEERRFKPMSSRRLGMEAFLMDEVLIQARTRRIIRSPESSPYFGDHHLPLPHVHRRRHRHHRSSERRERVVADADVEIDTNLSLLMQVDEDAPVPYRPGLTEYATVPLPVDAGCGYIATEVSGLDPWQLSEESRMFDMFINVDECA
ncbi:hypothetical protein BDZ89DRAFT_1059089 [Hymenopellis radicata]|nr:hypothetical protein BDZ89DRAFT_1059089 [Hymenopellis radicata]